MRSYFRYISSLHFSRILPFILLVVLLIVLKGKIVTSFAEVVLPKQFKLIELRSNRRVCQTNQTNIVHCLAHVVTDSAGNLINNITPLATSYGPVQFHTGYNLPCTPGGTFQSVCASPISFGPQKIALIEAYNDPNIASDLATYNTYYGLPSCTIANGCLTIVNESGGTTLPTTIDSGWSLETSLDVEVAHAICQTCKILLVEANAPSYSDLGTAVNEAAILGATEISNSYGGSEWSGEGAYDAAYSHPGIAVTVSSGDNGYGAEYPASSPNVVAIGGTTLQLFTDNTYAAESVWGGTGSGCSGYESANLWQVSLSNWNQTNCGTKRGITDVSADADPNTGAAVFDSIAYSGSQGWFQVGGTSLGAPLIAATYALAGGVQAGVNAENVPYLYFSSTNSHDITTGGNGNCTTIMCLAGVGYDGPTGLGSPNGDTGFMPTTVTPTVTPTLTPSVTPTPTVTNTPTPTPTPSQLFQFGYTKIGNKIDSFDQNYIDGSRFKMGNVNGTLQSLSAYVSSVENAPYNLYQLAIYTDNNGVPGTLLAKSLTGVLTGNAWNSLPLTAALHANTYYWLVYNTNATSNSLNDLVYINTRNPMGTFSSSQVVFGLWPTTFLATLDRFEYSLYATYTTP